MKVNGTDYSHILWKVIKFMFQTTNQLYQYCWVLYTVIYHTVGWYIKNVPRFQTTNQKQTKSPGLLHR